MAEPARTGRVNQRYDGDTRLVAGCLPVMPDGQVILIGSLQRDDWILPKGGWEHDETSAEAAVREAYEEAGVSTYTLYPCTVLSCTLRLFSPLGRCGRVLVLCRRARLGNFAKSGGDGFIFLRGTSHKVF